MPLGESARSRVVAYIVVLIALLLVAANTAMPRLRASFSANSSEAVQPLTVPDAWPASVPVPRAGDLVAAQRGFQHLVSYVGAQFVPASLTVGAGDTVRFTNRSSDPARLVLSGKRSPRLGRGEYWEHAFIEKGTFTVTNETDGTSLIVVVNQYE